MLFHLHFPCIMHVLSCSTHKLSIISLRLILKEWLTLVPFCIVTHPEYPAPILWYRDFQMEESSPNYSWCSHLIHLSFSDSLHLILHPSLSLSVSLSQAGSCHESLSAISVHKWLLKYGAIQRSLFNTHRCSFSPPPGSPSSLSLSLSLWLTFTT